MCLELFDWSKNAEDLLTDTRLEISKFLPCQFLIERDPTYGEKLNNICIVGEKKRCGFIKVLKGEHQFHLVIKKEILPCFLFERNIIKSPEPFKPSKCRDWYIFRNIDWETLKLIIRNI